MEVKISSNAGSDILVTDRLPDSIKHFRLPMSVISTAVCNFGTMAFQEIKGEGWSAWKSRYIINDAAEVTGMADMPIIELHTAQKNNFMYDWEGLRQPSLRALQFNLSYAPHVNNKVNFIKDQQYETFDFHLTSDMLKDYAIAYPELEEFLMKAEKKEPAQLGGECVLTNKMQNLLKEMEESYIKPDIYLKIMKAKVEVFIAEAMEILCTKKPPKKIVITAELKEKAMHAKHILETRLKDPPSIPELARLCTSNSYSIQFAFKNIFSMTIDEYSKEARMQCAKDLLLNTDWDLDSIADDTGYHDGPSLSRYFKKHVGCTPGEFRKYGKKRTQ